MWDDAVLASQKSGKPALVFDLDLVDSNSIKVAREVIADKGLQAFIRTHFEPALNDFAVDPPPSVGLDSLRNLGWRLSGLEKDYFISVRPAIVMIAPDKKEMDRIVFPQQLNSGQLEARLTEILQGKNTIQSTIAEFWQDSNSVEKRQKLIEMFQERSKYDSVLYHLQVLGKRNDVPDVAKEAQIRYAYLRLQIEGNTVPIEDLMSKLSSTPQDSSLHFDLLERLLEHFQVIKRVDSVSATYERILKFIHYRDPDILNDYAWHLASYSKDSMTDAYAMINEALSKDDKEPNYYDTRALVLGRMHRFDEAIRDEETALSYAAKSDKEYFQTQLSYYKKLKAEYDKLEAQKSSKAHADKK